MTQKFKNLGGVAIVLAVLALGYAALSYVHSYARSIQPSSFRSFSVTGQGKAIAIPDVAEFTFMVVSQGGKDLTTLQKQNTDASNKVIAFVKSKGVADKDIKTTYYDVSPDYQTYRCNITPVFNTVSGSGSGATSGVASGVMVPNIAVPTTASAPQTTTVCPPATIAGYTITQSVDVKVRDFSKIGDIVGGVVTNGANQVGQLSFTLDDPTVTQNLAEADAISKAKVQAEAIAKAGGFRLGRLLNVQIGGNVYPMYGGAVNASAMSFSAEKAAPAPTIQAGSQETDASVTLQYEIK